MIDVVGNRTVADLLEEAAELCPDKTWLIHESRDGAVESFTYGAFLDRVRRLAAGFLKTGITPQDVVVLHMRNHPAFLEAWFALAMLGTVSLPVNVDNTATELDFIVRHASATVVICDDAFAGRYADLRPDPLRLMISADPSASGPTLAGIAAGSPALPSLPPLASDAVMQLLFTSGTSSRPKAVQLTHANVLHGGERVVKGLALQSEDRCMTCLPLFHVNAQVMAVMAALTAKASCVLLEAFSASRYWNQARRHGVTCTSLVAMQLRTILAQPPRVDDASHTIRRMSFFINVTDAEKDQFEERFNVRLINGYGLTEAMGIVTFTPVFGRQNWPSIGLPTADRQVKIVDDEGRELPAGATGEIAVAGTPGRTVMKGYLNDAEATARVLREGWLYTGDQGRVDEKGYLYFVDRNIDLIKRSGENVSATEVESVLYEHPAVREAAVIGVLDPIRDQRIRAFISFKQDHAVEARMLHAFCETRLAAFKIPTEWIFLPGLPRTPIKGDIDKKMLRKFEKQNAVMTLG